MPRRHPWSAPHAESAKAPSTTGIGEPYTESWCQPAIARIGDRYPCSSKSRTRCSVSTLGISTLLRVVRRTQNGKGASESNADPLPESAVLIPYRAITVNRGRTGRDRCRREGFGRLFGVRDEKVTR